MVNKPLDIHSRVNISVILFKAIASSAKKSSEFLLIHSFPVVEVVREGFKKRFLNLFGTFWRNSFTRTDQIKNIIFALKSLVI